MFVVLDRPVPDHRASRKRGGVDRKVRWFTALIDQNGSFVGVTTPGEG